MAAVRRVVEPALLAAFHDSLQKRGTNVAELTPAQLTVELAQILDSWHIVEDAGDNRSKSGLLELLQETIGGHDAESWCMSTQQSITGVAEALLQKRSNLPASEGCVDVLNIARRTGVEVFSEHGEIQPGDIAIWQHLGSDRGHTGRVVRVKPDGSFTCLEGNTSGGGTGVDREGGGCYMKERDRKAHGNMVLVGFIRETFG